MTTTNKNFKVKNGLEVLGTSATVNGNDVLTTASSVDDLVDVSTSGAVEGQALVFDASLNLIPGTVSGGGGGGASGVITSDTKPSPATDGLEWHDTTDGNDYISVDGVWVGRAAPASVSSAVDIRLTTAETNISDLEQQVRPVILGGTGATTAADARTNLEITPANIGAANSSHSHLGLVKQVVMANKTNSYSTTASGWVAVPGLSVSITPASSSSKMLITANVNISLSGAGGDGLIRLVTNSTGSTVAIGNGDGGYFAQVAGQDYFQSDMKSITFLYSPSTTNNHSYWIEINRAANTMYVNGRGYDGGFTTASQIVVQELAQV